MFKPCKSCGSDKQSKFTAEIDIHFPGLKDINKPVVWVLREVLICPNCGHSEFVVPTDQLPVLAEDQVRAAPQSG